MFSVVVRRCAKKELNYYAEKAVNFHLSDTVSKFSCLKR